MSPQRHPRFRAVGMLLYFPLKPGWACYKPLPILYPVKLDFQIGKITSTDIPITLTISFPNSEETLYARQIKE